MCVWDYIVVSPPIIRFLEKFCPFCVCFCCEKHLNHFLISLPMPKINLSYSRGLWHFPIHLPFNVCVVKVLLSFHTGELPLISGQTTDVVLLPKREYCPKHTRNQNKMSNSDWPVNTMAIITHTKEPVTHSLICTNHELTQFNVEF